MLIEGLILAAIAVAQVATAVYIVFLVISEIVNWFQNNRKLTANDREEIGFTLQKRLKNGKYNTVQGIFNKSTNSLDAVRKVKSSRIDDELAGYHRDTDLVVYD